MQNFIYSIYNNFIYNNYNNCNWRYIAVFVICKIIQKKHYFTHTILSLFLVHILSVDALIGTTTWRLID